MYADFVNLNFNLHLISYKNFFEICPDISSYGKGHVCRHLILKQGAVINAKDCHSPLLVGVLKILQQLRHTHMDTAVYSCLSHSCGPTGKMRAVFVDLIFNWPSIIWMTCQSYLVHIIIGLHKMGRLYTIEHPGKSRIMIKADGIEEIKSAAIEKFKLAREQSYKLILMPQKIEIDDDEILSDYTIQQGNNPIVFLVVDADADVENNSNQRENAKENNKNVENTSQVQGNGGVPTPSPLVSVEEGVWKLIPSDILRDLNEGKKLEGRDKTVVMHQVRDYMYYTIKDCRRSKAEELARLLSRKYPATFCATVGSSNQTCGEGFEPTFGSLYNAVVYLKWVEEKKKQRAGSSKNPESDEEQPIKKRTITKFDVYGCAEYAPMLPETENQNTQEEKRLQLLGQYALKSTDNVSELMMQCYPTIRLKLNEKTDLLDVEKDWPFLQTPEFFLDHCNKLLGKDVINTWTESLKKKCTGINDFMRQHKIMKKNENFKKIRKECKTACEARRDEIPNSIAAILSVIIYFSETDTLLYKITNSESSTDSDTSPYPFLEVKGASLYDELAEKTVIIDGKYKIKTNDVIEGLLITFMAYYVYGICYPPGLAKTLEFIQRLLMDINPTEGTKYKTNKKKNFDAGVLKLSKLLNEFTDNFNM